MGSPKLRLNDAAFPYPFAVRKDSRLGQLSQKWTSVGKFEEKLGNSIPDESYALKTKILFTKLGADILTLN